MDAATAALVGSGITGAVSLMVGLGTAWVTGSRAEERQRIELQAERRREQREAAADLIVAGRRWGTSMKRIVTAIHAFDDPVTTMQEQSWMAETAADDQAFRRSLTVARLQVDHDPVLAALDGASTDLAAVDISHLVQAKFSGQPTTVYYELAVGQLDLAGVSGLSRS